MSRYNIGELLAYGCHILKAHNLETYRLDAQLLLMEATGFNKVEILTNPNREVEKPQREKYFNFLVKRIEKMPVQYIINRCEFMSLDFFVSPEVLIPRPDTETLVEVAIEMIKKRKYKKVLELCTGSGCIAVSLAHYLKDIDITAIDISEKALNVAVMNAQNNQVEHRIDFIQSDMYKGIEHVTEMDLIISNPPYIQTSVIESLDPSVKSYEPLMALDGGIDGLFFYKEIISGSKNFLKLGGAVLLEIGYDQGFQVKALLEKALFDQVQIIKDLSGLDRVLQGIYTPKAT